MYEREAQPRRTRSTGHGTRTQPRTCEVSTQTDSSEDSNWQPRVPRSLATSQTEYRNVPTPPWYHGGLDPLDRELAGREPIRPCAQRAEAPERREPTSRRRRQPLSTNEVEKLLRNVDSFSGKDGEDAEEI